MLKDNTYAYRKALRARARASLGATVALDYFLDFVHLWDAREYELANEIRQDAKDLRFTKTVKLMNQYTDL